MIDVLAVTADSTYANRAVSRLGESGEFRVAVAESASDAVERVSNEGVNCVVSDLDLPDGDGVSLLETVRERKPELPFVLFTDDGDETVASRAISAGVTDYLVRGEDGDGWDRLDEAVARAVDDFRSGAGFVGDPRARRVLDAARDAIAVVREGRIEYANASGLELFGATARDELRGTAVADVVDSRECTFTDEALAAVRTGRRRFERLEATLVGIDGERTAVEVTATGVESVDGRAVVLVVRDVTDRKRRERKYRRFREAVEHAGHSVVITDTDGRIEYVNPAFERITGYSEREALGANPRILKSGHHGREFYEELWETILGGERWQAEVVNERKDGERFVVDQTIAPIFDENDDIDRFVGVYRDVTEREERERELELFRKAVERAGHAVMITDRDGVIEYVNTAFEDKTGYDREEAVGRTPRILKSGKQDAAFYEELWETILGGERWQAEIVNRRKSGELYSVEQTIAPVTNDDGEIAHFVGIESDITDRRLREQRIAVLNRVLRHNIRNAVTVVEGRARQLADRIEDPADRSAAAAIADRAESLATISEKATSMNELLQRDHDAPSCDVASLVDRLLGSLRERHPEAEIVADLERETVHALVDGEMLRTALEEAVENAVVHNDRPAPSVRVTVRDSADAREQVVVAVADDGPGIPDQERTVIEQGVETPLVHGSSIGMWTIRWAADVYGGEVTISDNDPRGSVVEIALPEATDGNGGGGTAGRERFTRPAEGN